MKETVILSNLNQTELLRSLSLNGKNSFNVHVYKSLDLSKEALLRSGLLYKEKEINLTNQEFIIYNLSKEVDYFKDNTFIDSKHLTKTINDSRLLCRNNETDKLKEVFSDGEFKDKNTSILDVYNKYNEYKNKNNLYDYIDIINLVINKSSTVFDEIITFKEETLKPLDEELIKKIAKKHVIQSISEYADKNNNKLKKITYDNGYGQVNEVEHILSYIALNKIPYEDVTISLIDNSYINQFKNYRDIYDIPMTFNTGISISNSNAYKLLVDIDNWNNNYNNSDSFDNIINSSEFDKEKFLNKISNEKLTKRNIKDLIKQVGNLKLKIGNNENKLNNYKKSTDDIKLIENVVNEFNKGYSYFIKEYTKIDNEVLENTSINVITSFIDEYFKNIEGDDLKEILYEMDQKYVLKEKSKNKHLHITNLIGSLEVIRKHLFICGLNEKNFPGSPKEDYLLLDSDLKRFNETNINDSNSKIINNKKLLKDIVNDAAAFNTNIHLSYSGYNLSELKEENPSSMLYEIYKLEHGDSSSYDDLDKEIGEQHRYFDANISSLKEMGEYYINGYDVKENDFKDENIKTILNKPLSPSSLEKYFDCPKRFYLTTVLGIEEPEEDNPFVVIPASDEGTLVHECMEDYGNNPNWTLDEFLNNAKNKIDNYLNKRIPIHNKNVQNTIDNFLDLAKEGFNTDPHNEIYQSEYKVGPYKDPKTGLTFEGRVDRIEKLKDGNYQIVDYKTYRDIKNEEHDLKTCFQVVLYAYMLENTENKKIENCQYRYLRMQNVNVDCIYNEQMKEQLENKLKEFKEALDKGEFPIASKDDRDKKEVCKYCKLSSICGVKNKEGE